MTEEELKAIEIFKHWIEYEKVNKDKINKADELIQVQETLLNLIEKQQKELEKLRIKNGKEFVRGMETNEKLWQAKIENKIETIQNETWYVDGSAEARQACIDELMSL